MEGIIATAVGGELRLPPKLLNKLVQLTAEIGVELGGD